MAIAAQIVVLFVIVIIGNFLNKIQVAKKQRSQQSGTIIANSAVNKHLSKPNIQTTVDRANIYQSVSAGDNVYTDPDNIEVKIVDRNQHQGQITAAALEEALRSQLGTENE